MDDMQREARVADESPTTSSGEVHEPTTALSTGRLLANPRRTRRA